MSVFQQLPPVKRHSKYFFYLRDMVKVNAHIHTPYSFSAFGSIPEALDKAVAEGMCVLKTGLSGYEICGRLHAAGVPDKG